MRSRERAGHLLRHVERRIQAQWPASHLLAQCLAFDKLADDVMRAISFADLVNGQDVWVVERGGRFRFVFETSHAIRIFCEGGGQYFERDLAFESGIFCQEDFSHPATAEQADDLVMPDAAPDRRLIAIIIRAPRSARENWRVNEAALPLVGSDKSLGLRAQLLVIATHPPQMGRPRFPLKLQSLVEQVIQFFPSLRRHSS